MRHHFARVLHPQRDREPQPDQASEILLACRAGDPDSEDRLPLRRRSRGLRRLDQAPKVRPPGRAPAFASPCERLCGVAPVETDQAARVARHAPAHVCDARERARLRLEVRIVERASEPRAGFFVARGPVRLLARPRAIERMAARAPKNRVGLLGATE